MGAGEATSAPAAAFYCVSSAPYFLGAVATINSLRLVGHTEPIHLLDCGLTDEQRELLGAHVELGSAPPGRAPYELKPFLPLARPAPAMALIDSDMIVTRSLAPLIARARAGNVVAFRNHADRHVATWGSALGLGEVPRRPYLCSGFIALGREPGQGVLATLADRQDRVDFGRSYFDGHDDDYELLYADQDVLNAVLASRVDASRVVALPHRLAPTIPFAGVRVVDERTLRCELEDGDEPYLLHHSLSPKPWQRPAYEGAYTRLLRRLLTGDDLAVSPPRSWLPPDLRRGPLAFARRQRVKARQQLRWRLGQHRP